MFSGYLRLGKAGTISLILSLAISAITVPVAARAAFTIGSPSNFQAADQEKSYLLSVDYDKKNYSVDEISVINAAAPDRNSQPETGFRCEIVSMNDEILYSFNFGQPNIQCGDNFDSNQKIVSGGCAEKESGTFSLAMPYFKTGKLIAIYDQNDKMVLNVNTSDYAQLCGDDVCQANENFGICPSDCRSGIKDSYCDKAKDGVCDSDCTANLDPDCAKGGVNIFYIAATALVLLIAVLAGYFLWRRRKINDQPDEE